MMKRNQISSVLQIAITSLILVFCTANATTHQDGARAQSQPGNNTINEAATNPVSPSEPGTQVQTFVGTISDSFCLRHHYMLSNATPAECTRYCRAHNGQYVLLVGDKAYVLENDPGAVLMKLAGQEARITGNVVNGNTIEIKSVTAGSGK